MNSYVTTAFLKSLSSATSPILLEADETTIGRDPSCKVALEADAAGVSRQHTSIRRNGQQFSIADLGSSNGTFVNGQRLQSEQILRSGDRIQLGAQGPQFEFVDPAASSQPAPTQVELPVQNATPPTVIGNAPVAAVNPYGAPNQAIPPVNQYAVGSAQPLQTPQSSEGKLNWFWIGGGLVAGGIGLLIALRLGASLLGSGLVAGSGGAPAPAQSPTETSPTETSSPAPAQSPEAGSPQAPTDPQTQPAGEQPTASGAPVVKEAFICESPNGDACTSDGPLTRKSAVTYTIEFEAPLDTSTRYQPSIEYTSPQGKKDNINLDPKTLDSPASILVLTLSGPDSGWPPGTYGFTVVAENGAGSASHTKIVTIQ